MPRRKVGHASRARSEQYTLGPGKDEPDAPRRPSQPTVPACSCGRASPRHTCRVTYRRIRASRPDRRVAIRIVVRVNGETGKGSYVLCECQRCRCRRCRVASCSSNVFETTESPYPIQGTRLIKFLKLRPASLLCL